MKDQPQLEKCISEIIENAEKDRSAAYSMLSDLTEEIDNSADHDNEKLERSGVTAQKLISTAQASNDQIIKVLKELRRIADSGEGEGSFSVDDMADDLYNRIEEKTEEGGVEEDG